MNYPTIQIPGHTHYINDVNDIQLMVSSLTPELLDVFSYFLHGYGRIDKNETLHYLLFTPKRYYIDALGSMWFSIFKNAINEVAISYYDEKRIDIRPQVEESNDN